MNNEKLNNLVKTYQSERSDETFTQLYEMVSANWRSLDTVGKSVKASEADILAGYQDTLLNCIEAYDGRADFINMLNRSIRYKRSDIYRKNKRIYHYETFDTPFENEDGSEPASFEIADDFNLEEQIIAKKKADQLALIDSLLSDADETTTAIVESILSDKRVYPAINHAEIARKLDLNHRSVVYRKLERLAGKFDSKQFGSHQDYLVAL